MALMILDEPISLEIVEEVDDDEQIVPQRIGMCTNAIEIIGRDRNKKIVNRLCCNAILEDDIEMVELRPVGNKRVFCCGPCVEKLLTLSVVTQADPEKSKNARKLRWAKGVNVSRGSRPRLHKGEDLLK